MRKVWRVLRREGTDVGRDHVCVARLMCTLGLAGAVRERNIRTTRPADLAARPADLVEQTFAAPAPNHLWVADLTYVWTIAGFCYTGFIVDVFGRVASLSIVGWRVAASMRTDLTHDALHMTLFSRGGQLPGLVHHSDRGVQYLAIRYTEHLAEAGVVNSVGSKGHSYDNALAKTVNGLYNTELIKRQRSWRRVEEVELATAASAHWWNESWLHRACGDIPPAEYEEAYDRQLQQPSPRESKRWSLHLLPRPVR